MDFYVENINVAGDMLIVVYTEPVDDVAPKVIESTVLRIDRTVIPRAAAALVESLEDLVGAVVPDLAPWLTAIDVAVEDTDQAVLTCRYPRRGDEQGRAEFRFNPAACEAEIDALSDAAQAVVDARTVIDRHPEDG